MSVSVDDTGKELPATNDAETRATDAVRELKRGASCKEVLKTLWPSDAVDEASLAAFARILRNDAILARCPPKPSYLRQVLAKTVSKATDAGYSDDALCEELAQAVVRDDDNEDAASHARRLPSSARNERTASATARNRGSTTRAQSSLWSLRRMRSTLTGASGASLTRCTKSPRDHPSICKYVTTWSLSYNSGALT